MDHTQQRIRSVMGSFRAWEAVLQRTIPRTAHVSYRDYGLYSKTIRKIRRS